MASLTEYLNKTPLEEITTENVLSTFGDVTKKNEKEDLYASHMLLNRKRDDEDKVCKILEIFFQNGLDPNKRGFAGYTFLHIALYGGETEDGKTVPYSLSLFKRIIPIARKYGFDVNCKDEDGDTLIHTAIYSEDYFDKIEPLIRLLGPNFDVTAKNKQGETILDALNHSMKEAKATKNTAWGKQLSKEKVLLTTIVKAASDPLFHIPEYVSDSIDISDYLDTEYYKKEILEKIDTLMSEFEAEESEKLTMMQTSKRCKTLRESVTNSGLTEEEKEDCIKKINEQEAQIIQELKRKLEEKINELTIDSSLNECKKIQVSIQQSYLPVEIVEEFENRVIIIIEKINQQLFIKQLKKEIESIQTVGDIEHCLKEASKIKNPDFKQEMMDELTKKHQEAKKRLDQLKAKFQSVQNLLKADKDYFGAQNYQNEKRKVFGNLNLREIKEEEMKTLIVIQYFNEYEEGLEALSEEIMNSMREMMAKEIRSELKKASIIDREVGTHLLEGLAAEFTNALEAKNKELESTTSKEETQASLPKTKRKKG